MRIGFATAVSLQFLRHLVKDGENMPPGYQFAPAADWIKELLNRGHDVTVYTTSAELQEAKTFYGDRLTIRIAKLRTWGTGKDFFAPERHQMTKMMLEDQCDVIHAHWTYEFPLAALETGIPTLITIHDLPWNVLRYLTDKYRVARLIMAYLVALRGKHFTAVSQNAADHFRRYFKPGAKVDVISNGLPEAIFEIGGQTPIQSAGQVTFATVLQGWTVRKNATAALKAFALVHRELPGTRLLMFGTDFEPGGKAQRWAAEEKLEAGVTFVGVLPYADLLQRVHTEVDVLVHPSLDEAFSMAILEGMALRKAVIAGKSTPGCGEALEHGKAGILTDTSKPEEIAREMERLVHDTALREAMGTKAYERARSLYRINVVMGQYEALYRRILGQ